MPFNLWRKPGCEVIRHGNCKKGKCRVPHPQIDEHGNIIREPEKRGEKALKDKISQLEAENADLLKQVSELKKSAKGFREIK